MKTLNAGICGTADKEDLLLIQELSVPEEWRKALLAFAPSETLRPVQTKALQEFNILESRRNLIVCAPTNSGKTLIGYLVALDAVKKGLRAVILEPLRAVAQEKADELKTILSSIPKDFFPKKPKVRISTGDYRLEHEYPQDSPSGAGEIIVATPERLEATLRSQSNDEWLGSVSAVIVDEAHLIRDPNRGPTLEYLIAILRTFTVPPRLALLSATIGSPERLSDWLSPCDLIVDKERRPQLIKEVLVVESGEDANAVLLDTLREILSEDGTSILVFVYRRNSCASLATFLNEQIRESLGEAGALAYHSGMSSAERQSVKDLYLKMESRCVITTTALAMGVNLPATHVLLRDTTFHGLRRLSIDEILQMLGRAGRGSKPGKGIVLVRPSDDWEALELANELQAEKINPICSAFDLEEAPFNGRNHRGPSENDNAAKVSLSLLSRFGKDGFEKDQIFAVVQNMLAGPKLTSMTTGALSWLVAQKLGYVDENDKYHLTVLGERTAKAVLPPRYAVGFGQLIRDLLEIDPEDRLVARWAPIDHLIVLELLSERSRNLKPFSKGLAEQIDSRMEGRSPSDKSLLFNEWICGNPGFSKSDELLGSLGLTESSKPKNREEAARKAGYLAAMRAIILDDIGKGTPFDDLERAWRISGLGGIQESWRDNNLWLLSGQVKLLDLKCFYYHLRENCAADDDRIKRLKVIFQRMRTQVYDLMEHLKYCSPLGPLMRGIRNMLKNSNDPKIGPGTIKKLEESGIKSILELATMEVDTLVQLGIRKSFAKQIKQYVRRRML